MLPLTLAGWGEKIISTEDPLAKVQLTLDAGSWWNSSPELPVGKGNVLDVPPRPSSFEIVAPGKAPSRGKAGSLKSRISILHALANVEQWAIDTAWDNIVRFGSVTDKEELPFPKSYYDDFVKMALDEAKHFNWLTARLSELGSHFGELPIHAGIWESAEGTKNNFPARMAIVHMVHEARGLDINPTTIANFRKHGDETSAKMLDVIYTDEITHVAIGTRWFKHFCENNPDAIQSTIKQSVTVKDQGDVEIEDGVENSLQNYPDSAQFFHILVHNHFFGNLKPPFNYAARDEACLPRDFYEPLTEYPPSPFAP